MKTITLSFLIFLICPLVYGQETVRVASYNIKFLTDDISAERKANLENVLNEMEADVIGLQEIEDRRALENIFPSDDWHIIIDDDSPERQDLAIVTRKEFTIFGFSSGTFDADDQHFLFPESEDDLFFPDRRDVLAVEIGVPNDQGRFWLLVAHTKARFGGRHTTDFRRVGAANAIVDVIEREFDERDFILLGDMNDSPDDASLNILETGVPTMIAMMENDPGDFMINLAESLYAEDHVSFGRSNSDRLSSDNNKISTIQPGIRRLNFDERFNDTNIGDCLFDQILIPPQMLNKYVMGSYSIFDGASAVNGNSSTRASDHLPVYADFVFFHEEEDVVSSDIKIGGLLPNPTGTDSNNERIRLVNTSDHDIDVSGWEFIDRAENKHPVSGSVAAGDTLEIQLENGKMPLNNNGDTIRLINDSGDEIDVVTYNRADVKEGQFIVFE